MSTFAQWQLLLRVHLRIARNQLAHSLTHSRLMTGTIVSFLLTYLIAAYWLFGEGLEYVANFPAAGALLSDRIVFIMFFSFMSMLIFSVGVTSYISIYRSSDTRWLLTFPLSHHTIFLWKVFEGALFSSWGIIFILSPFLLALADVRDVSWWFIIKSLIALIPFLVITSCLGSLALITAVRFFSRRQIAIAAILAGLLLIGSIVQTAFTDTQIVKQNNLGELSTAFTFQRVLRYTDLTINRGLPSTWLATSIINWTRPFFQLTNLLYPILLVSNALMGMLLVFYAAKRWFYRSWNRSIQHSATIAIKRSLTGGSISSQSKSQGTFSSWHLRKLVGRPNATISRKDFLTLIREPGQWIQFTIVFGLLAIYSSGLRQINGEMENPRDLYLVAFLNLAVCALALSTLTTRFVFPQFSLEGRKLWILAMSPLKLPSLVTQKFVNSTLFSGCIVAGILMIGGYNLRLGMGDSIFFAVAILLLAIGLNALAVGLGVLFPNLEESNTAKIVSGFGGTLCLIGSFIFILTFMFLLAFARWEIFTTNQVDPLWYTQTQSQIALAALLFITATITLTSLIFSQKKLKRLEIISNS